MMKTLEYLYQGHEIHFLVNPHDKNVMINATEMAKLFDKRTNNYIRNEATQEFMNAIKRTHIRGQIGEVQTENINYKLIEDRGRNGIYFCELLAIDFATWLDVDFKLWVYQKIQEVIFGNYKKHWEAHAQQEQARVAMDLLKDQLLINPTPETVAEYFEQEKNWKQAKYEKSKAIRNQLSLFQ